MRKRVKHIYRVNIFISSPSDVAEEREIIRRVIEKLNRFKFISEKYLLKPLAYEHEAPPVAGMEAQEVVDRYMIEPKDCYLFICVMWSKMGTEFTHSETGERFQSGTHYEFLSAYKAYQEQGNPHILIYRRTQENTSADPDQQAKVDTFFRDFEGGKLKGLYKSYETPAQFEESLLVDIEQILAKHTPVLRKEQKIERPEIKEEPRRLDAAMPRQVSVGKSTEVWVQICLPDSEGFKPKLPVYTEEGDRINQEDVREGNLTVAFTIDKATGKPKPIEVIVEIRASDFSLDEPIQKTILYWQQDSGLLVFGLTARKTSTHSIVHVKVKSTGVDGSMVTLGSAALSTEIEKERSLIAQAAWSVLSLPLSVISQSQIQIRTRDPNVNYASFRVGDKIVGDPLLTILYIDLSGVDLVEANLVHAILRYANLSGAILRRADLSGAYMDHANGRRTNLTDANLSRTDLSDADLTEADLTRANLTGAKLYGANLTGANLTGAKLYGARLFGAKLNRANLTKADLTGADLTGANLTETNFNKATFDVTTELPDGTNWTRQIDMTCFTDPEHPEFWRGNEIRRSDNLQGVDLSKINLQGVNLRETDLSSTNLCGTNLCGASLRDTDLSRADLTGANLRGADMRGVIMHETNLATADLNGANVSRATLQNTDLRATNLKGANLRHTNLHNTLLIQADLTGADLTGAQLRGVNLSGAFLRTVVLKWTKFDNETILPDGTKWTPSADLTRFTDPTHLDFYYKDTEYQLVRV